MMTTEELLAQLERLPIELEVSLREMVDNEFTYSTIKREGVENLEQTMEEMRAHLLTTTKLTGSNKEMRDAQFIELLATNEEYQAKKQSMRSARARLATAENDMKLTQAKAKAAGYQLRATIAAAHLMASIMSGEASDDSIPF